MKNTVIILFAGSTLCISGCSSGNDDAVESASIRNSYGIELVNNEKWVVNENMMIHIKNMASDIQAFSKDDNKNYDELGVKLNDNIGLLTSNCTMTGQAHDELHKWLLPFIDLVGEMNEASGEAEKAIVFKSIEESMDEFNSYFK